VRFATTASQFRMDRLARQADRVVEMSKRIWDTAGGTRRSVQEADTALAVLAEIDASDTTMNALYEPIHDLSSAADEDLIKMQIAFLIGAFPGSTAPDPVVYGRAMVLEVMAAQPSQLALHFACSRLRRNLKWPPAISQVLDALRDVQQDWDHRKGPLLGVTGQHETAVVRITQERGALKRHEAGEIDWSQCHAELERVRADCPVHRLHYWPGLDDDDETEWA
jgi:hypothetical protein